MKTTTPRSRIRTPRFAILTLVILATAAPLVAQEASDADPPDLDRPKIGLALSGGGAKGCAHVGVLQVLEELNVPIDYIAGTSMGAVVGGLYAAGVPADVLGQTLIDIDWDDLLEDDPPRKYLSFRRKDDDRRYQTGFQLGLQGFKVVLPTGMRSGQKLGLMLSVMTERSADIRQFDQLPIPFHAVATDIGAAEMYVMKEGDLAQAIRASMAIPGFFTAVNLDGRVLVDGGSTNNVPVDVVRAMGADIVIAIDIGAQFSNEEMTSLTRITGQTMGMLTRINMAERLAQADMVITPPVSGTYGTMDFNEAEAIIQVGLEEARLHTAELSALAIDPEAFRRHRESQTLPAPEPFTLGFVEFTGNERVDDRQIQEHLPFEPGDTLDMDKLIDDVGTLFGRGDFKSVGFITEERDGEHGLVLHLEEKPWGPNYLHAGINFTTNLDGESSFNFITNVTATQLNARGGEWRNDFRLGADLGLFTEFYQPLNFKGNWFFSPAVTWERRRIRFFLDGQSVAQIKIGELSADLDFGYVIGRSAEVRLGLEYGSFDLSLDTGLVPPPDDAEVSNLNIGGAALEINLDRLDNVAVPHTGSLGHARYFLAEESLGAEQNYQKLEGFYGGFTSFGKHTLLGMVQAGGSPGGDLPIYDEFTLGGFLSLSGYAPQQLRGQYMGVARLGYYYNFSSNWHIGGWLEAGNVWEESSDFGKDLIGTGTIFLGSTSILGPLHIAYGVSEDGNNQLYISVGKLISRNAE